MPYKPKSGAQRRRERVAIGLPRYTPGEAVARQARNAQRALARSEENFKFVTELKLKMGCIDCGYRDHPAALDFDHLPGFEKRGGIARMMGYHRNTLLAEIAKCEVVCSNCHRIRTWKRRQDAASPSKPSAVTGAAYDLVGGNA
jgi:hypothetical protein